MPSFPTQLSTDQANGASALYESRPDCIKILELDGTIKQLSPGGKIALALDRQDQLDGTS